MKGLSRGPCSLGWRENVPWLSSCSRMLQLFREWELGGLQGKPGFPGKDEQVAGERTEAQLSGHRAPCCWRELATAWCSLSQRPAVGHKLPPNRGPGPQHSHTQNEPQDHRAVCPDTSAGSGPDQQGTKGGEEGPASTSELGAGKGGWVSSRQRCQFPKQWRRADHIASRD